MNAMPNWTSSPPVPVVPRPPKPERKPVDLSTPALRQLQSALDAIPQETRPLDYDDWRNVIFAIHYATEGAGLEMAHAFSARSSKYEPEFLDDRVWPYIGISSAEPVTERTLFALAATHGWQDPTLIDDFEVVETPADEDDFEALPADDSPRPNGKDRFRVMTEDEFLDAPPVSWMIKGVLPQAEMGVMFGESGSGKTFMVLDMAAAVAQGIEWRGRRVRQGRVVYVAAEGAAGVRNRMRAYRRQNDLASTGIKVIASAPNLMEKEDAKDVCRAILASGGADLVIIDTLAQSMPGGNENSGEDIGRVLSHCKGVHRATGAMVLLIHHSGKDASKGARGWSGLRAACDVELEVRRADDDRALTVSKLKDAEDGAEFGFKLLQVLLEMDSDGDEVSSCVVVHGEVVRKTKLKGANQRTVADTFEELIGLADDDEGVEREALIVAAVDQLERGDGVKDRRRELVIKAIESLTEAGYWDVRGARFHRKQS